MNVTVTGGAGYVGSVCVAYLLAEGHRVTVFDSLHYGAESLLAFHGSPQFVLMPGDVRSKGALTDAMRGCEAVVHLAAIVGETACSVDPPLAWSINHDGTRTALQAAEAAGVSRFLFVSTCSNYGVASAATIADEDAPLVPLSRYAEAKVAAERDVLAHVGAMTVTVVRLGTICGVSPRMRFDLLVSELARAAVLREDISLYTPDAWRPFLHIQDAARAFAMWLDAPAAAVDRRVFNIVGENYQKRGLAELVLRHFPNARIAVTDRAPDQRDYRVSGDRIAHELGFMTTRTVEDAFVETARAVADGVFRNPHWPGHSAVPVDQRFFTHST